MREKKSLAITWKDGNKRILNDGDTYNVYGKVTIGAFGTEGTLDICRVILTYENQELFGEIVFSNSLARISMNHILDLRDGGKL